MKKLHVSIVVPLYNESAVVKQFHKNLTAAISKCDETFEILYIDDGSADGTLNLLQTIADHDKRVTVLELTRNFGHQSALLAGLEHSTGDVVITMDGDGQHPPELIADMIRAHNASTCHVVIGLRRGDQVKWQKRVLSKLFYVVLNKLSDVYHLPDAADFRLMSRQVVNDLIGLPERKRYLRGLVSWLGYKSLILPFDQPQRIAGKPGYSFWRSMKFAMDAFSAFSRIPFRRSLDERKGRPEYVLIRKYRGNNGIV